VLELIIVVFIIAPVHVVCNLHYTFSPTNYIKPHALFAHQTPNLHVSFKAWPTHHGARFRLVR